MRQSSVRQSVAPTRQSHLLPQSVNPVTAAKLLEKKKEFEAVQALERASTQFLRRIEGLGDDFDVMADAGVGESFSCLSHPCATVQCAVCGQVLEQWPNMFRILSLFRECSVASLSY